MIQPLFDLPKLALNLVFVLLFSVPSLYAYDDEPTHEYAKYDWEENRKRFDIPTHLNEEPSLVLMDKNIVEYFYRPEEQSVYVYKTYHVVRWLNSTDAVERYNKIYIPVGGGFLVNLKVRSISPDGKEVISDQSNLKEIKNEESGRGVKIFAIEGVEKGSEIEYFFTTREPFKDYLQEGRQYLQTGTHTRNVLFELITPDHLDFEIKEYNGLPKAELIEENDKRIKRIALDSIEAIKGEPFSFVDAERMRVDYKFAYNLGSNSRQRIRTWADASNQLHSIYFGTFNKKEDKALKKLYGNIGIKSGDNIETRIRKIENFVKVKIQSEESSNPKFSVIDEIASNKIANERGLVRLFTNLLKMADVPFELGLTTDRSNVKFDEDFDVWLNLREFLIYFPDTKKYLAPAVPFYRYGLVPATWTANEGLFIREMTLGETTSGLGTVRYIQPLKGDANFSNIDLEMSFGEDLQEMKGDLSYSFGGLSGVGVQGVLPYIDQEKKDELVENLLSNITGDADYENITLKNEKINTDLLDKPFTIDATFTTESWVEKAGNKVLFSIGKTIGAQSELYSEDERELQIESSNNRVYNRKLVFTIPEGYTVKNLEDLASEVVFEREEEKICGFVSKYKQDGNTVTVDIFEYYYEIFMPVEEFEEYRKVINAAADFNKIVLVLEEK